MRVVIFGAAGKTGGLLVVLMPTFLRGSTKDKIMMENEVIQSGLNYIYRHPPRTKKSRKSCVNIVR